MWYLAKISLRVVALIAGLLTCYLAAFLYEKGRGRMRNKLEDWWIERRRNPEFAASPPSAFMRALAFDTSIRAYRVFGDSLESIAYYASLSLMSCLLSLLALIVPQKVGVGWSNPLILLRIAADKDLRWIILGALSPWLTVFLLGLFVYGFSSFVSSGISTIRQTVKDLRSTQGRSKLLVSVRNAIPKFSFRSRLKDLVAAFYGLGRFLMLLVVFITYAFFMPLLLIFGVGWLGFLAYLGLHLLTGVTGAQLPWGWAVLIALAATTTTVLFLATMRRTLERCESWPFKKSMIALLSICVIASLLFLGPLWFGLESRTLPALKVAGNATPGIALYLAFSNTVDVLAAYGFVATALLMLVHRIVWPQLKKPVTALRLAGVSLNRNWLWGIGITLLLSATGWLPALVNEFASNPEIVKDIEDFFKSFIP